MYRILYFSKFSNDWREFVAAAWGAKAIRHDTREDADSRMARLARDYPNDTFKVEPVE